MINIQTFSSQGITESLTHFNMAMDLIQNRRKKIEVCDLLFKGLNKLQTEWLSRNRIFLQENSTNEDKIGEVKTFKEFVSSSLNDNENAALLKSKEFQNFAHFHPPILNHDILRRYDYDREKEIPSDIVKNASEKHLKLQNALKRIEDENIPENQKAAIKKMADLLYVVRSNIAHGEKTPFGPDRKKSQRDESVTVVTIPLQLLLFNMLLGDPAEKLFVYGSLAPGQSNYQILSEMHGTWTNCKIRGSITKNAKLQYFKWDVYGEEIDAKLFTTPDLKDKWNSIDRFEGSSYQRHLITGRLSNGDLTVANIYLAPEPDS
jgi:gamma-glutamylcyclotransferase (GGCT)/AIG2-like uncharacterized protein YtfP